MNVLEQILELETKQLQSMTHEQLISLLIERRRYFLETEIEYGNSEYLDEILEELKS